MVILQLFLAFVILSILVVVHEFGHFIVAKKIGVWAEEFGIGLPPRVWGKKIGETIYSINALPIGGFVRLHGEVDQKEEDIKYPDRAFVNKSALPRIAVALAGVVMNVIFAVLCFSAIYTLTGVPVENHSEVIVMEVVSKSPADKAGLKEGDVITEINGIKVDAYNFRDILTEKAGEEVTLMFKSDKDITVAKTILNDISDENGIIGVLAPPAIKEYRYPVWYEAPFEYLGRGIEDTRFWAERTIVGFAKIFSDVSVGESPKGVLGPVGITAVLAETVTTGLTNTLWLAGIISINLAILNIIPFPPLDGSRVALIIAERFLGKKFVRKHEARVYLAGMAVLITLIVLMTINEIPKLISAGSISGFVDSILQ